MHTEPPKPDRRSIFKDEAERLRAIWDATPRNMSQAEFGETFDIGGQSAVGNFLRGFSPLSLKAAIGFSRGLGVPIERFSTRLADQAHALAEITEGADADFEHRRKLNAARTRKYLVAVHDPSTEQQIGMVLLQASSLSEAHELGLRLIEKHQASIKTDVEQLQTAVFEVESLKPTRGE
ncbi:hypothetical protein [Delftia acidovorans]|uniref:hypothetical protein n=1 Tax=Delftia acidovorans TaxID=80866 RepID=UPI003340E756